jgi:hypothetical protein
MARDIIITPKNQEPQIQFTGSGDVSSINLNVGSGISPVSGIREAGSGITTLSFEGTQGQLFSITDNLSSGTLFSVADITGLPLLEVDASGAVKISEYGTSTTVGLIDPKYNFDVFGTGGFQGVVSDKFELYASGDALSDGQEKLMIYDNDGTFEIRSSGQGGGSINNFKIVSDRAAISSEENYIAIDGQKSGDNLICRLRLNGSNRFKFYNEGFAPEASNKNLGGNSSTARWKSIWGRYLDVDGFNSTTTTLSVGSSAAQSANIAEFKASDNVVVASVAPDGSISSSGDIGASGDLTVSGGDVIFTGNHRKFSGSNTYTFFGGVNSFLLANTMFAPVNSQTVDKHLGYSTTGRRWTKIWGEQGDFSGNIAVSGSITCSTNATIDGTSTVGLFKIYGLGDASATDSEFLQVAHVANSYYISTKKTGSATGRDLIFQRDSQNALKLASSEITSYKSVIPSTDGTLSLGSSSYKWGDIHCGGELKTANIGYTDGDNAMTIADGGKVTFAAGFAVGSDAEGDILYHNGTSYVRLAKGTDDYVLKMNGNVPNWEAESGGGGSSTLASLTDTNISSPANGHILIYDNATSKWDNALMTSTGGTISFTFGAGTINLEAGGVGPSDERLKENVKSIEGSLDKILAMNPVEFEWRDGYEDIHKNSGKDIGFIAQDIEKIQPELVGEHKDFKTLDYEKFSPLIVGAIQELTEQIQEIKKHLNM